MNITGAKKAVIKYRAIRNRGNYAIIYVDRETGVVWTNEYTNPYSWTQYDSASITAVSSEITVKDVTETALQLCEEYSRI